MNASCRLLYLLPRNACTVKLLTQIKLLIPTSYTTPTYNPLSYLPTCLPRNTFHSLPLTDLLHTLQNIIIDLPTYNTTPNIMWTTYLLTTQHPTSCVPRTYLSTYLQDKKTLSERTRRIDILLQLHMQAVSRRHETLSFDQLLPEWDLLVQRGGWVPRGRAGLPYDYAR